MAPPSKLDHLKNRAKKSLASSFDSLIRVSCSRSKVKVKSCSSLWKIYVYIIFMFHSVWNRAWPLCRVCSSWYSSYADLPGLWPHDQFKREQSFSMHGYTSNRREQLRLITQSSHVTSSYVTSPQRHMAAHHPLHRLPYVLLTSTCLNCVQIGKTIKCLIVLYNIHCDLWNW